MSTSTSVLRRRKLVYESKMRHPRLSGGRRGRKGPQRKYEKDAGYERVQAGGGGDAVKAKAKQTEVAQMGKVVKMEEVEEPRTKKGDQAGGTAEWRE